MKSVWDIAEIGENKNNLRGHSPVNECVCLRLVHFARLREHGPAERDGGTYEFY